MESNIEHKTELTTTLLFILLFILFDWNKWKFVFSCNCSFFLLIFSTVTFTSLCYQTCQEFENQTQCVSKRVFLKLLKIKIHASASLGRNVRGSQNALSLLSANTSTNSIQSTPNSIPATDKCKYS